jgi:hypothetical protein
MHFGKTIKLLFSSNKNISKQDFFLAIIAFGIPFTIKLGNALLILGVTYSIFFLFKKKSIPFKSFTSFRFIFPAIFFLIVIISALFSKDIGAGLRQVEKNVLFPLVTFALIVISKLKPINIRFILNIFSVSTLLSALILVFIAFIRVFKGEGIEVLFFHELGGFFELHPVYIAINLAITILFLTDEYLVRKDFEFKNLLKIVLVFSIFTLFLCASKAVILCFIILYFIQLYDIYKPLIFRFTLLVSIVVLGVTVFITPRLSDRFLQGLHFDIEKFSPTSKVEEAVIFSNEEKSKISDLELRYLMLNIGLFHVIDDGKFLFGYGIGDVQDYIDYYYMFYGLAPGWFEGYNLHNQYLQYLVTYGVCVLLIFLAYLFFSLRLAILNRNRLHLFFLILISFVFLFECLLSRNKGIVIFIFLNTLFLINYKNENSYSGN